MNENETNLIELCTEKKLNVENTCYEKKDVHKFSWASGVDDGKSLLYLIVVQWRTRIKY